jgi:hypothetical protein
MCVLVFRKHVQSSHHHPQQQLQANVWQSQMSLPQPHKHHIKLDGHKLKAAAAQSNLLQVRAKHRMHINTETSLM